MTWDRDRFHAEVARADLFDAAYADDILVRLAHHSTAIEGNTLSLGDSFSLLVDEIAPAGASLRELYEIANHREGLQRAITAVAAAEPLTVGLVRELHAALMDHLLPDRGAFKLSSNIVVGAAFTPTPPERVPEAMRQWAEQTDWQTRRLEGAHLLEAIAHSHIAFERIHPFSDGNGRTGRLVLAYQTIFRFGVPAIVTADLRSEYINLLEEQDARGLATMIARLLADELDRR
ncbi:Fic family protein [Microbacterium sp.]|uniref:Fic family protein n=1 Tax=Microbacterium sp. TaxID=51671 RepID=UPI003C73D035